jgi:hypothetical protein
MQRGLAIVLDEFGGTADRHDGRYPGGTIGRFRTEMSLRGSSWKLGPAAGYSGTLRIDDFVALLPRSGTCRRWKPWADCS